MTSAASFTLHSVSYSTFYKTILLFHGNSYVPLLAYFSSFISLLFNRLFLNGFSTQFIHLCFWISPSLVWSFGSQLRNEAWNGLLTSGHASSYTEMQPRLLGLCFGALKNIHSVLCSGICPASASITTTAVKALLSEQSSLRTNRGLTGTHTTLSHPMTGLILSKLSTLLLCTTWSVRY